MNIGGWRISVIESGRFALDGGAMFGIIPKPLWEKKLAPDDRNRIPMALRVLLLEGHGRVLLIDTGMGEKWDEQGRRIYAVAPGGGLDAALAARGLAPDDVTDVLLTHLHFDHAGGATKRDGDRLVPAFPRARYHVQRGNLDYARRAGPKDRGSYRPENFEPLVAAGVVELSDGPGPLFDGIEVLMSHGHTRHQQHPKVTGPEGTLVYLADLVPTSHHLHLPWVMAYDIDPCRTIEEKDALLARAVAEDWRLAYEHDPHVAHSRVARGEQGYHAREPAAAAPRAGAS